MKTFNHFAAQITTELRLFTMENLAVLKGVAATAVDTRDSKKKKKLRQCQMLR